MAPQEWVPSVSSSLPRRQTLVKTKGLPIPQGRPFDIEDQLRIGLILSRIISTNINRRRMRNRATGAKRANVSAVTPSSDMTTSQGTIRANDTITTSIGLANVLLIVSIIYYFFRNKLYRKNHSKSIQRPDILELSLKSLGRIAQ